MNERLANGKGLSPKEVISIFCDMCEAVARLHHSKTPIIHRDLKVCVFFIFSILTHFSFRSRIFWLTSEIELPLQFMCSVISEVQQRRCVSYNCVLFSNYVRHVFQVLSLESHGARYIQDEIERYTTLSYRSPEMVDIYEGRPIGMGHFRLL